MLITLSLLLFAGMSLGMTQRETKAPIAGIPQGYEPVKNMSPCLQLSCLAEKIEIWAKANYWAKDYKEAVKYYHLLLKAGRCEFDDLYNLACSYAQMGNEKQAVKYLKLAISDGFKDIDHIMSDPDFEKIKDSPKFISAISKLSEQTKEANVSTASKDVKDAQMASGNAPLNSQKTEN
jgi:tetratricopeptide (TPR) repeat protein